LAYAQRILWRDIAAVLARTAGALIETTAGCIRLGEPRKIEQQKKEAQAERVTKTATDCSHGMHPSVL
jgi:hypothetical protein